MSKSELETNIQYDLDSMEQSYYPNPSKDWSVIIRIPAKPDWRDTQKDAQRVEDIIVKALRDAGL